MTQLTEYITQAGDRWDMVAFKAYGDPLNFQPIIDANPGFPILPLLPSGIRIVVPIIQTSDAVVVNLENLPPWKR